MREIEKLNTEKTLGFYMILVFGITLIGVLLLSPDFGIFEHKEAANYYLGSGLQDTGSANIVNSIVWDYRGYDTLGEETVLFTAALGVFFVLKKHKKGSKGGGAG